MSKQSKVNKQKKLQALRKIHGPNYGKEQCDSCHKMINSDYLIFGPDPYASEINGDHTVVALCRKCYSDSCDSI